MVDPAHLPLRQHRSHPRDWRQNYYVYPVISRRSQGLSIGINLNPDTACNFDCIYCQVDRSGEPRVRDVNPARLELELRTLIQDAVDGLLYNDPSFVDVPQSMRAIRDLAFSGDGEPTTCKIFRECVQLAANCKTEAGLGETKLVLITDACYLTRPPVVEALEIMDRNNGEIWAKLDAGTEDYYQKINKPNYPLSHVIENITSTARVRPVVIQSLFMQVSGVGPDEAELAAYCDRLNEITADGGMISFVQVYTVARTPAEANVTPLTDDAVDGIVKVVKGRTGLQAAAFYGYA
jgi:wyosine [tRNA(Phe)-imidazoG37] synthetase (radical SAM superfamily)